MKRVCYCVLAFSVNIYRRDEKFIDQQLPRRTGENDVTRLSMEKPAGITFPYTFGCPNKRGET